MSPLKDLKIELLVVETHELSNCGGLQAKVLG